MSSAGASHCLMRDLDFGTSFLGHQLVPCWLHSFCWRYLDIDSSCVGNTWHGPTVHLLLAELNLHNYAFAAADEVVRVKTCKCFRYNNLTRLAPGLILHRALHLGHETIRISWDIPTYPNLSQLIRYIGISSQDKFPG
jgi:hypothetical protein